MSNWTDAISAARVAQAGYLRKTPCFGVNLLDFAGEVSVKFENLQHTGSFKARGAFNTLLSQTPPAAGVVAASGGNHGAAVAHAARKLGLPARIFVPELSSASKQALIRRTGADLVVVPGAYSDALAAARAYEEETGALQIHAYDAEQTVIGQGTLFAEWQEQGLDVDTVVVAVGGGGLLAGAMAWFGENTRFVAAETFGCATLCEALNLGEPVDVEISGIAADALGARRIGEICFGLGRARDLRSVLVRDESVVAAQRFLWENFRQLVEPAGAVALAALLEGAYTPAPGERVGVLVCGGNITPDPLDLTAAGDREAEGCETSSGSGAQILRLGV